MAANVNKIRRLYEPYHVQQELIDKVDFSKRYIIIEAPTGFGKSFIGVRAHFETGAKKSLIITSTRQLQLQYLETCGHSGLVVQFGRNSRLVFRVAGMLDGRRSEITVSNYLLFDKLDQTYDLVVVDEGDDIESLQAAASKGKQIVVMSATILNPKLLLASKGIQADDSEISYASVGPLVKKELRPIFFDPIDNVSFKNGQFDKIGDGVLKYVQAYRGLRGIVHTVNFKLTEALEGKLSPVLGNDLLVQSPKTNRVEVVNKFRNGEGRVLIGPSLLRGLDLPGDLGRFVIFAKVPFPNLTEKAPEGVEWQEWYEWSTIRSLVQGAGRCSRSEFDWSLVYILDSNFGWFYKRNKNKFPEWWEVK